MLNIRNLFKKTTIVPILDVEKPVKPIHVASHTIKIKEPTQYIPPVKHFTFFSSSSLPITPENYS